MKILCLCEEGNNRSVHLAWLLKYRGVEKIGKKYEVIPAGVHNLSLETLTMLYDWAEFIIITDSHIVPVMSPENEKKVKIYNVGPDDYHRPMNSELLNKFRAYIKGETDF